MSILVKTEDDRAYDVQVEYAVRQDDRRKIQTKVTAAPGERVILGGMRAHSRTTSEDGTVREDDEESTVSLQVP